MPTAREIPIAYGRAPELSPVANEAKVSATIPNSKSSTDSINDLDINSLASNLPNLSIFILSKNRTGERKKSQPLGKTERRMGK